MLDCLVIVPIALSLIREGAGFAYNPRDGRSTESADYQAVPGATHVTRKLEASRAAAANRTRYRLTSEQ